MQSETAKKAQLLAAMAAHPEAKIREAGRQLEKLAGRWTLQQLAQEIRSMIAEARAAQETR